MNSPGLSMSPQPGAAANHQPLHDPAEVVAVRVEAPKRLRQWPAARALLGALQRTLKGLCNALGLTAAALPALACVLESRLSGRDELFLLCGQTLAFVPGLPGKFLRKCFYYWTLEACPLSCDIGFLSYFNDRRVRIGPRVYIGSDVHIGTATLGEGALIGSRTSIINGGHQHRFGPDGRLTAFDPAVIPRVRIGEETWIGEAVILMADVGSRCVVAAGSVLSSPIPDGCIVGGNPVRFVGRTTNPTTEGRRS